MHLLFVDTARWVPEPPSEFTDLNCKPADATTHLCGLWETNGEWSKNNNLEYSNGDRLAGGLPAVLDHRWNGESLIIIQIIILLTHSLVLYYFSRI
jgi:hypothetical protein